MTTLEQRYFTWLCEYADYDAYRNSSKYRNLLNYLYQVDYIPLHDRDINRALDGQRLRYRFGSDEGLSDEIISSELDYRACSLLEMMIALAIRIEDDVMYDPEMGLRVAKWFWKMVNNLGLTDMKDTHYYEPTVEEVVSIFLAGKYEANGAGGLFKLNNPPYDLRTHEIWDQMNRYLLEKYY